MFSKLKNQLPPASLLAAGLLIVTLLTALSGLLNYNQELANQPAAKLTAGLSGKAAGFISANKVTNPSANSSSAKISSTATGGYRAATNRSGSPASTSATTAAANSQPAAAPAAQPSAISVTLSVNGSGKGQVRLTAGSNQCDVLTQARAEGVISSLNMRYNSQYGSEAVYVIDGIGDPGTVNWTYAVNGTPPPYGCSFAQAHNGDSVNWQYQ